MATRAAARGPAPKASTAVIPATLDRDTLMALLAESGMAPKGGDSQFRRMSAVSGSLVTDPGTPDEESWPPVKNGPTMTVRIVKPPVYYNAFFMSVDEKNGSINPNRIGRPDLNGKFAKRYDDPAEQAADQFANPEAFALLEQATGSRGQFRADIQLQIVPESGELTGDEPVYTLSLSTTSALDWRGTTKNPEAGVAQEKNFITQLAEFAQAQAVEAGATTEAQLMKAVLDAMTSLRLGGVVADIYLLRQQNPKDPSITWTVVAFKPVHIENSAEFPALPEGETPADGPEASSDDIPF